MSEGAWTFERSREAGRQASAAQHAAEKHAAQFWARVDVRSPDECWPWTGYRGPTGYGRIHGPTYGHNLAHRYALAISGTEIRDGDLVLHSCDNSSCCNPAHLRVGDHVENAQDRVRRGRSANVAGEANPFARLTAREVQEIRELIAHGWLQHEVAAKYGVVQTTISRIARGERWAA